MILRPSRGKVGAASLYAAGRKAPGGAFLYIHNLKDIFFLTYTPKFLA